MHRSIPIILAMMMLTACTPPQVLSPSATPVPVNVTLLVTPTAPPPPITSLFPGRMIYTGTQPFNSLLWQGITRAVDQPDRWQLIVRRWDNPAVFDYDYSPVSNRMLIGLLEAKAGLRGQSVHGLTIRDLTTDKTETVFDTGIVAAAWMPDGRSFTYIREMTDTHGLWLRDASGRDRLLARDVPHEIGVSPDGQWIVFTRESGYFPDSSYALGHYAVQVSTGKTSLVSSADRAGQGGLGELGLTAWSLDSRYFVARINGRTAEHDGLVWVDLTTNEDVIVRNDLLSKAIAVATGEGRACLIQNSRLVHGNRIWASVGECPDNPSDPIPDGRIALIEVDPKTDTFTVNLQRAPEPSQILVWDEPGISYVGNTNDGTIKTLQLQP